MAEDWSLDLLQAFKLGETRIYIFSCYCTVRSLKDKAREYYLEMLRVKTQPNTKLRDVFSETVGIYILDNWK